MAMVDIGAMAAMAMVGAMAMAVMEAMVTTMARERQRLFRLLRLPLRLSLDTDMEATEATEAMAAMVVTTAAMVEEVTTVAMAEGTTMAGVVTIQPMGT